MSQRVELSSHHLFFIAVVSLILIVARDDTMKGWVPVKPVDPSPRPAIVTGRPKAELSLRFSLFYVWCCSVFKCFNFNTSVCPICLVQ